MQYENDMQIGGRVYVVRLDKLTVTPARVVERILRETSEGALTSYVLDFGVQGTERVSTDRLVGCSIVDDVGAAYDVIINHFQEHARRVISAAVKRGEERFGPSDVHSSAPEETGDVVGDFNDARMVNHTPEPEAPTMPPVHTGNAGPPGQINGEKEQPASNDDPRTYAEGENER